MPVPETKETEIHLDQQPIFTVPFYESPDWKDTPATHCGQTVVIMVLAHFLPGKDYTWEELTELTHQAPGKGTSTTGIVLSLNRLGLKTFQIADFDYERLAREGLLYIRDRYKGNPDLIKFIEKTANIEHEQMLARQSLEINPSAFINKSPTLNDLETYVQNSDYLVICQVNAKRLNGIEGNTGHYTVLIPKGISQEGITFHDPGGSCHPPEAYRKVPLPHFLRAWWGEKEEDGAIIVIEKP